MRIVFKLYASLGRYLPPRPDGGDVSTKHECVIEVPADATPAWVIEHHGVPEAMAHLVLLNGVFVAPSARTTTTLTEDDELVVFPPVAGG